MGLKKWFSTKKRNTKTSLKGTVYYNWIQTDQTIDSNAEITPESVTMYLKVKFTTTGTPTYGEQLHVCIATDPTFLTNMNLYTVASSPTGSIGQYYFATGVTEDSPHPAIEYDTWFWEKIVVDGDSVSVWAYAEEDAPADTATYTFTTDNVAIGEGAPTFIIFGVTDDDFSAIYIDEIWYNETPFGSGQAHPFFSEYAEGSSNNKYLEIYNPTDGDVFLDDYVILGNYNGNPWSEAFTFAPGQYSEAAMFMFLPTPVPAMQFRHSPMKSTPTLSRGILCPLTEMMFEPLPKLLVVTLLF